MPQTLVRYTLDPTGVNPDNLIRGETHVLSDRRYRAIAPRYGAFFTQGLVLTDTFNNRILAKGTDYEFTELYQTPTIKYGKEIVGCIVVINTQVSADVSLTYQALGGDFSGNIDALVHFLETRNDGALSTSYLDVMNKPSTFVPSPHIHDLGDGMGFEFLVFALERLRSALVWGDSQTVVGLANKVDESINNVAQMSRYRLDTELAQYLLDFKAQFSKESLGLGNVVNLPIATESEGSFASRDDFNLGGDVNDRYVTLRSLIAFKEGLLSRVVSTDTTGIGKRYGQLMLPTIGGLESLTNGARVLVDTLDSTVLSGIQHDRAVYPDLTNSSVRWSIVKVSNNEKDRGGIFTAVNASTGSVYTGVLSISGVSKSLVWRKLMTESDADTFLGKLTSHLNDIRNPHKTSKNQLDLSHVENLPVASIQTILARKPTREHVTYDGLLLFMKAYITGNWQIDPSLTNPDDASQARSIQAYQTLFAPTGPSGYTTGLVLEQAPRATLAPVPPRGTEIGWHCESTTKVIKFTDGFGGYYIEQKMLDIDCGYVPPNATFAIRDLNDLILGYGFPNGGNIDPQASVRLDDADGVALCYIYASAATGRTSEIRNASGITLGFAINA